MWRLFRLFSPHPSCLLTRQAGICAGKDSVAAYLIQKHDFKRIHLSPKPVTPLVENGEDDRGVLMSSHDQVNGDQDHTFDDIDALLDFVTRNWREHFVTTDIWDDSTLDLLLRRPFFFLVGVDAPVSLRWKRFSDRYIPTLL